LADYSLILTFIKSNIYVFRHGIKGELDYNKSIFISFVLYKEDLNKKTIKNKTVLTKLFTIALLVTVALKDFFGIFLRRL
jgi:hypothetical protein